MNTKLIVIPEDVYNNVYTISQILLDILKTKELSDFDRQRIRYIVKLVHDSNILMNEHYSNY